MVASAVAAAIGVAEDWVVPGCLVTLGSGVFALGVFMLGVDDGVTEAEGLTATDCSGVALVLALGFGLRPGLLVGPDTGPAAVWPASGSVLPAGGLTLGGVRFPPCQTQAMLPPCGTLSPSTPMLE